MRRTLLIPALLLLAAAPAAAQNTIRPGQSVTGELALNDPTLNDGSHYDVWRFRAEPLHRYRVRLHSDDFDAFLIVGPNATEDGCDGCARDDDGAGGTDALVEFTGAEDGTYEILANAISEGETGSYELTLEDAGLISGDGGEHEHGENEPAVAGTPIGLEQVSGELARGDTKIGHAYSDTWTYQGREGEIITVTVRSEDFDTLLEIGAYDSGECSGMDSDDNSGGGTDSRITIRLPEDGAYHLHVSSEDQGGVGRYTLTVEPVADVPAVPSAVEMGADMEGWLTEGDAREQDRGSLYDLWTFRGTAGETVRITMKSDEFDTYLYFGRMVDGEWVVIDTNDDGEENTDSELTVTLPDTGEYQIHASAFVERGSGPYRLRVERQ